jgi:multiple sugar transport system substrate-binding protein
VKLRLERFFGECADEYKGVTDPSKGRDECSQIQILTNKWNAEHPDTPIEPVVVDPGQYYTRLAAEFASGSPPDIAVMHGAQVPNYASLGALTPLGPRLQAAGIDTQDFVPAAREFASFEDQVYALPYDIHTLVWYVNADLFKQAGLADARGNPRLPKNREEFLAAARTMKERTGKQFVQAQTIDADLGTDWTLSGLVWQQGGDLVSKDGRRATVNTPEAMEGVKLWQELIKGGYTTPDVKDTNAMFLNGEVATLINGTWAVNQFDTQVKEGQAAFKRLRVAPFPTLFREPAAWSNSHAWVLPAQRDADPAKTDAAVRFLKFLYDNNLQWARTGHLSVRNSVLTGKEYNALPHRKDYAESARIARTLPRIRQIDAFQAALKEEILGIYLGQKPAQQGLSDAERRATEALNSSPAP